MTAADPHETQPWERVLRGGIPVGYARTTGRMTLFSTDGYGWSGEVIPHDARAPQVPLRLNSQRIYHGDLVALAPPNGEQATVERVIAILSDSSVWLVDPAGVRDIALAEMWPPPSTPRVLRNLGSRLHEPCTRRRLRGLDEAASQAMRRRAARLGALVSYMLLGLATSCALQLTVTSHIGPLTSLAGAFLGSILYWTAARRACWSALRRHSMLTLSGHAALLLAAFGAVAGVVSGITEPVPKATGELAVLVGAGAALGGLAGLICAALGGDLVAWRTGGYGEVHTERNGRFSTP